MDSRDDRHTISAGAWGDKKREGGGGLGGSVVDVVKVGSCVRQREVGERGEWYEAKRRKWWKGTRDT